MSELEKTTYDRGFYNGIREARQVFAKHLNVSTSTDEIKWDNVSKTDILSEIDDFMMKNESYPQPQLTIHKSVADELDKIPNEAKRYVQENGYDDYSILDDFVELREFYESDEDDIFPKFMELKDFVKDNLNLCVMYLAGKALGVDLVKVVPDEN